MVAARTIRLSKTTKNIAYKHAMLIVRFVFSPDKWRESLNKYRTWEIVDVSTRSGDIQSFSLSLT